MAEDDAGLLPFRWSADQLTELRWALRQSQQEHRRHGWEWDVGPVMQVVELWVQTNPPSRRPQGG